MKMPTRPAPEPPMIGFPKWQKQSLQQLNKPTVSTERFSNSERLKLSRSQSTGKLGECKKPPPRPPPPPLKLSITSKTDCRRKQGPILSGLFSRNKPSANGVAQRHTVDSLGAEGGHAAAPFGLLIDLNSPPSSPTPTTRSSSSTFSLNSLEIDGANGLSSQIKNGFEDDFNLKMVYNTTLSDPFSMRQTTLADGSFELSNDDPRSRHNKPIRNVQESTKPTIIRPKNNKPARPPPPKLRPSSTPPTLYRGDWSPPMPRCPPPPPPPEVFNGPSLPPRPTSPLSKQDNGAPKKMPYCIALYDYETGHPGDLSFKENDVIHLTDKINDDWLRGKFMGREGMFPASFTNIVVPLEPFCPENENNSKYVIALFSFKAETWDDLPFQEGETVKITRRINAHWLYGECNGKKGQFPENYVTDVSALYPQMDSNL